MGIDDYALEVVPEGYMLVCVNYDRPGVVGQVGTLLGEAKVNIAGMQLGRDVPGGGPSSSSPWTRSPPPRSWRP